MTMIGFDRFSACPAAPSVKAVSTQTITFANDVRICAQTFGDPADPAVVLAHGASASMLWWDAELCEQLARTGRFVVRYDQRDTGLSTTYPVGQPGYSMADLAHDLLELMDRLGIGKAHLVGCSAAGGLVLLLGVDHPERFHSLTFLDTTTGDSDLPPPTGHFPEGPDDLSDPDVQVEYVLEQVRAYDGVSPYFDEDAARALIQADVDRSKDLRPALTNPYLIEISEPRNGGFAEIALPTLVLHGELDPMFPLPHGEAIARAVPGARLVVLEGQGHDLLRHSWDTFVSALAVHTSRRS
jgi:pimeloyl-ACP methyl ester carboxylesterase